MQFKTFMDTMKTEAVDRQDRSDYKLNQAGRKTHKQITFHDGVSTNDKEKEKPEMKEEMTDAQKAERERLVKGMKKSMAGFKAKYGERAKEVMYATATKKAMEEAKEETPPFDGPYKKATGDGSVKDKSGAVHTPMSRARDLARQAMKKQMKEAKDEQEYGYEGDMALNQLATLTRCAEMIKDMLKPDTDMPEWVQSKITLATDYIQTAADYMYSEMNEALKGKQHKLDKNKNGKLDAHDFKLLRKEDAELEEAFINGREYASHGLMHPDHAASALHKVTGQHIDFYAHGSGDKVEGKVTKNDGKAVHIKDTKGTTHKFKVQRGLPKQQNEQAPVAPSLMKHRISVTVSDPDHTMVSKRKEKMQKSVIVTHSSNKEGAQKVGEKFYKKKGFIVHDSHHAGMVNEETDLDEKYTLAQGKPPRDAGKFTPHDQRRVDTTSTGGKIHAGTVYTGKDKPAEKPEPRKSAQVSSAMDRLRSRMKPVTEETAGESYEEAQKHKETAEQHDKDSEKYHHNMSMHHEAMGRWHESKGRTSLAHKEFNKADSHHEQGVEKAMKNESTMTTAERDRLAKADADKYTADRAAYVAKHGEKATRQNTDLPPSHPKSAESLAKKMKEEVETIDELDKSTLASYVKKSSSKQFAAGHKAASADSGTEMKAINKAQKRSQGVAKAVDRLTRESADFDQEGNLMAEKLKFSDFIAKMNEQLLEYESDTGGVYRHTKKATYGTSYQGDDEDDKPKKPAPTGEKRGRGRPAGSKSGANQKVSSGKSYGGIAVHSLNLPK